MSEKSKEESEELSELKEIKKNLKPLIKGEIVDIVLFGSSVKEKFKPSDLDVAIITKNSEGIEIDKLSKIREKIKKNIEEVDTEVIPINELYTTEFGFNILTEGYSVKEEKKLNQMMNIEPYNIYSYSLEDLTRSKKTTFNRSLKRLLGEKRGEKIGRGVIKVQKENSGEIEDFLKNWEVWENTEKLKVLSY